MVKLKWNCENYIVRCSLKGINERNKVIVIGLNRINKYIKCNK